MATTRAVELKAAAFAGAPPPPPQPTLGGYRFSLSRSLSWFSLPPLPFLSFVATRPPPPCLVPRAAALSKLLKVVYPWGCPEPRLAGWHRAGVRIPPRQQLYSGPAHWLLTAVCQKGLRERELCSVTWGPPLSLRRRLSGCGPARVPLVGGAAHPAHRCFPQCDAGCKSWKLTSSGLRQLIPYRRSSSRWESCPQVRVPSACRA